MTGHFIRLSEEERPHVTIRVDGEAVPALLGDTLLVAILLSGGQSRRALRGGFCLMGSCQDCWLWREDGRRIQACMTYVEDGLSVLGAPPGR